MDALRALRRVDGATVLAFAALATASVLFVRSATFEHPLFAGQDVKQAVFFAIGAVVGVATLLVSYARVMRAAWGLYALSILLLLGLRVFGSEFNGARRWYDLRVIAVQPSELAKLTTILALAAWFRFPQDAARTRGLRALLVPCAITALPAGLVAAQPDLGSSLVFWPVAFATCYAAGVRGRTLLGALVGLGAGLLLVYACGLHDYQRVRVDTWLAHFAWLDPAYDWHAEPVDGAMPARTAIRGPAYQPWQALIAIGAGGWSGFGWLQGPQNRYDFLPYRSCDYLFAVIAEETGFVGALLVLAAFAALVLAILAIAGRTRERFGRLLAVGVASYLGAQALLHVAVCLWLVPAKGLPLPLLSYGGSSTIVATLGVALALNVGARREPVLASDGYE
jgi:rod shape determining protein RodA